jgi:hypothetical protein
VALQSFEGNGIVAAAREKEEKRREWSRGENSV